MRCDAHRREGRVDDHHHTRNASGHPDRPYDAADLSSKAFWSQTPQQREDTFAQLRAERPVSWHPPFEDQLIDDPGDHGFWAIVGYDDLVEVTKRHEDFLSGHGILLESLPPELIENAQSIIAMDPPRHTKMRRLVASAFTPKQMRRIQDRIEANAKLVVDHLIKQAAASADGVVDFATECAALLPMHNISDIVGVPNGQRQRAAEEAAVGTGWNDPELVGHTKQEVLTRLFQAQVSLHEIASNLAGERRENPTDDLTTALALAEIDGERLTDAEIGSFFVLLTIAGNDTTRQSTAHGLKALTDHPEQRAWLLEDLPERIGPAAEELVRWATPIMTFRRTAARDLEFRGQQITAGDKVVLFYSSANRADASIERATSWTWPVTSTCTSASAAAARDPPLPGQPARPLPAPRPVHRAAHTRPAHRVDRRARADPRQLLQPGQARPCRLNLD
ncbi:MULTISPECIES: cytochrome P450 [unclassified Pseudonocardia]|uniref:cytochrome P450 n=1 Tax=unclassified Pseudonocardia TaxID=2619320 RepID=UPI0001FFF21C|nr:cytochrome P450 [Pseudonocardia sp. Ae707_Ps1]OLM09185.1 putative cytochrome P450 hydroxylase [Pseudonocardia sp. Ae707_Ps1]